MKKLLVLMLVLGMASIANATFVLSGDALTQTGTVSVVATGATADAYLAVVIDAPAAVSNFALGASAPTLSGLAQAPITVNGDTGEVWMFGASVGEAYKDGTWLTANWSGATSYLTISLYETPDGSTYNLIDTSLVGIPEPATMALLGIGSLFMLRRRK